MTLGKKLKRKFLVLLTGLETQKVYCTTQPILGGKKLFLSLAMVMEAEAQSQQVQNQLLQKLQLQKHQQLMKYLKKLSRNLKLQQALGNFRAQTSSNLKVALTMK
jgi:hypothetical protein